MHSLVIYPGRGPESARIVHKGMGQCNERAARPSRARSAGGGQVAESLSADAGVASDQRSGGGLRHRRGRASMSMKSARGMSCAPRLSRCGVAIWQSIIWKPRGDQLVAQPLERDLRGIALDAEHRFAEEHARRARRRTGRRPAARPARSRPSARSPSLCSSQIGGAHFRRQPGAARAAARVLPQARITSRNAVSMRVTKPRLRIDLRETARDASTRRGTAPRADPGTTTGSAGRASTRERCRVGRRRADAAATGRRPPRAGRPARAARDRPAGTRPANRVRTARRSSLCIGTARCPVEASASTSLRERHVLCHLPHVFDPRRSRS